MKPVAQWAYDKITAVEKMSNSIHWRNFCSLQTNNSLFWVSNLILCSCAAGYAGKPYITLICSFTIPGKCFRETFGKLEIWVFRLLYLLDFSSCFSSEQLCAQQGSTESCFYKYFLFSIISCMRPFSSYWFLVTHTSLILSRISWKMTFTTLCFSTVHIAY